MKALLKLVNVRDPRRGGERKTHVFKEIVAIAILAKLSGAQTFNKMEDFGKIRREWLGTFLSLPHGIPSHDTFNRAIRAISEKDFEVRFRAWAEAMRADAAQFDAEKPQPQRLVAIDGKAVRRAGFKGKAPIIVGAWDERTGIALGQERVEEKSNEITAAPRLLKGIDIHETLDKGHGEDLSRARIGNAPQNLALMRRAVLNVFSRDAQGRGLRRCQKNAAWNPAYLEALLSDND